MFSYRYSVWFFGFCFFFNIHHPQAFTLPLRNWPSSSPHVDLTFSAALQFNFERLAVGILEQPWKHLLISLIGSFCFVFPPVSGETWLAWLSVGEFGSPNSPDTHPPHVKVETVFKRWAGRALWLKGKLDMWRSFSCCGDVEVLLNINDTIHFLVPGLFCGNLIPAVIIFLGMAKHKL